MKKLLILLGFMSVSGLANAQYVPISREPISPILNDNQQYQQQYGQRQITYQRVTGTNKSGHTAPFRVKYVNGHIQAVEYYQSYNGWRTCYSFSRTTKSLIADDYEQAYDYKAKPTYNSTYYYF